MKHHPVSIFSTHRFSQLMEDYVNQAPLLENLYGRSHKRENYKDQLEDRKKYEVNRDVLVDALLEQYASINLEQGFPQVFENINSLRSSNTFTVVTGHQLCLFTGPLYFIYKIINTIRLAEELSSELKTKVVPVFWMATEDHDFDEVNHIWYNDLKYQWNRNSGDAVGRITTEGIGEVIDQLDQVTGKSTSVEDWLNLLRRSYREGQTLASATRELTNELFGHKGLVVLDADHVDLKRCAITAFANEIENHFSSKAMEGTSSLLAEKYFTQVTPRDINLFYLRDGQRFRLTASDGKIVTVDGPYAFTQDEAIAELQTHPNRFSPNVVLRPVYQEIILPNLAYIGGGGELAYWLQLKPVFDQIHLPFPILRLRNSVGFVRKRYVHKMNKLNLGFEDIVEPVFQQKRAHFREELNLGTDMEILERKAEDLYKSMFELASRIDPTLEDTAKAYNARQEHLLKNFEKKILRAKQRRELEVTRMFDEIHSEAFPSGGLQERRENYITLLERFGPDVLETLMNELDPFDHTFSWFVES